MVGTVRSYAISCSEKGFNYTLILLFILQMHIFMPEMKLDDQIFRHNCMKWIVYAQSKDFTGIPSHSQPSSTAAVGW
jgi:hypothetical protein